MIVIILNSAISLIVTLYSLCQANMQLKLSAINALSSTPSMGCNINFFLSSELNFSTGEANKKIATFYSEKEYREITSLLI